MIAARRADADDVDRFVRQQRRHVGIGADAVPVGELLRRVVVHVRHADDLRVGGQFEQRVGVEIGDYAAADDAEAEFSPVVCHKNIP